MKLFFSESEFPILLAPMAGITDLPFREMCVSLGADFSYTEMVSAKGLFYGGKNTQSLLEFSDKEKKCGIQLFGAEADIVADMAKELSLKHSEKLALIDINMGCPAKKITKNGEGSALMLDINKASKIIKAAVKASKVPVTVKFRKGYDDKNLNALEFAKMAEESGASMITVHGRTREQMYSGKADWDIIARIKQEVKIPVIGNGDIFSGEDALKMKEYTKCDGIMVARGARGNPFIFNEIKAYINGEEYAQPTVSERIDKAIEHAEKMRRYKGERSVIEMRKHAAWYISSMHGASEMRVKLNLAKSFDDMIELFENYKQALNS